MRIRVNFTLDIPDDKLNLKNLLSVSESESKREAAEFVRMESSEMIRGYLDDNGVKVRIIESWEKR